MDLPVARGERWDCGMGGAGVAGGCEYDKRADSAKCGEFLSYLEI